ncbi:MAG: beta-phosphoglucomutase [Lachnospiraceae bacterium]|nr:beta-phosphoglucomutase [Lachnospiraceae bacterium]
MIKGFIFDLDGVIVDTAKYHYLAWKRLADEIGLRFSIQDNELLKGVSRIRSFEIILELNGKEMREEDIERFCARKNGYYVDYISRITPDEILPGVEAFLQDAKKAGMKIALGSASKNASVILERTGVGSYFDAVIDGTKVSRAKPHPEVFLKGAEALLLQPEECVVFEDAVAGIVAAHNGGMKAVGVGNSELKDLCDCFIASFNDLTASVIVKKIA